MINFLNLNRIILRLMTMLILQPSSWINSGEETKAEGGKESAGSRFLPNGRRIERPCQLLGGSIPFWN